MGFAIRPLGDGFGAEIVGLDLGQALSDGDFAMVRRAWFEAGVIVFRDQTLAPASQVAFSRRFGPQGRAHSPRPLQRDPCKPRLSYSFSRSFDRLRMSGGNRSW